MKSSFSNFPRHFRTMSAGLALLVCSLGVSLSPCALAAKAVPQVPLTAEQILTFAQLNKLTADQVNVLQADLAAITADQAKVAADQKIVDNFKATLSPDPKQRKPNELKLASLEKQVGMDQAKLKADQAKMVAQQVKWTLPVK